MVIRYGNEKTAVTPCFLAEQRVFGLIHSASQIHILKWLQPDHLRDIVAEKFWEDRIEARGVLFEVSRLKEVIFLSVLPGIKISIDAVEELDYFGDHSHWETRVWVQTSVFEPMRIHSFQHLVALLKGVNA